MVPKLSKDAGRVRRRILHHVTRGITDEEVKKLYDKHFKDLVHDAITVVLASEEMATEHLKRMLE